MATMNTDYPVHHPALLLACCSSKENQTLSPQANTFEMNSTFISTSKTHRLILFSGGSTVFGLRTAPSHAVHVLTRFSNLETLVGILVRCMPVGEDGSAWQSTPVCLACLP